MTVILSEKSMVENKVLPAPCPQKRCLGKLVVKKYNRGMGKGKWYVACTACGHKERIRVESPDQGKLFEVDKI